MAKKVLIPIQLRKLVDNETEVEVGAETIAGLIEELQFRYPGVQERLLETTGRIRGSVAVFLNGEDIRFLNQQQTALKDGDEISIIPAFSGG